MTPSGKEPPRRKPPSGKIEEYRRILQDLAIHPPHASRRGGEERGEIAQEGKASKLATEIQGEQSKAPKPHTAARPEENTDTHRKTANSRAPKR